MAFNGSGTFARTNGDNTGSTTWQLDRDDGDKITASRHDAHDQDLADGLTNCICKDGQTTPTADLPMGGYKHTNVDEAAARTQYARASQVQDSALTYAGATGGTTTAVTATLSPAITAYVDGMRIVLKAWVDISASATLNINSIGAKAIYRNSKSASATSETITKGDVLSGNMFEVVYNSSLAAGAGGWMLLSALPESTIPMSVSAAGSAQGDATQLTWATSFAVVTAAATNYGVKLPSISSVDVGRKYYIYFSAGAINLKVYPYSGGTINQESANNPIELTGGQGVNIIAGLSGKWYAF